MPTAQDYCNFFNNKIKRIGINIKATLDGVKQQYHFVDQHYFEFILNVFTPVMGEETIKIINWRPEKLSPLDVSSNLSLKLHAKAIAPAMATLTNVSFK